MRNAILILTILAVPCFGATINVNWDGTGDYTTIQAGINAAINGDTVEVAVGTYVENINFNGKNIILTSANLNAPESTIIDGSYNGHVVTFSGSETPDCKLLGFKITNGSVHYDDGAGICGNGTYATISNCMITGNRAFGDTCIPGPVFGAGLWNCDGSIINCIVTANRAIVGYGGGLANCDGTIRNCTIAGNEAYHAGTGLSECSGSIVNCTIVGNDAYNDVNVLFGCIGSIFNCIIWDNGTNKLYDSSTPTYSCIQNWTGGGTGNITSDPLFVDSDNGDYHLKSEHGHAQLEGGIWNDNGTPADPNDDFWEVASVQWVYDDLTSPCIDMGYPASDWTAELWPHGKRINMGAYGGTAEASMSASTAGNVANFNNDGFVNIEDLALFAEKWPTEELLLAEDINRNGVVDFADWAEFAAQWLWQE